MTRRAEHACPDWSSSFTSTFKLTISLQLHLLRLHLIYTFILFTGKSQWHSREMKHASPRERVQLEFEWNHRLLLSASFDGYLLSSSRTTS